MDGRVAVITGGSSGIGAALADALVDEGATVAVMDVLDAERASAVDHMKVDVADQAEVDEAFAQVVERHGRLDAVVSAAAVLDGYAQINETDDRLFDRVMNINAAGAMRVSRAAAPYMRQAGYGRIVLFSSIAGLVAGAGGVAYTMSKHAILGLTKHLANELGPSGITCNAIAPGSVGGTRIRSNMPALIPGHELDQSRGLAVMSEDDVKKVYPVGRIGDVQAIVPLTLHLLSPQAWFVNGSVMPIDGGYTAR